MTSTLVLLAVFSQLIHCTVAQFSFDVQAGINIGLQVGVSIAICLITIFTLIGIINLLKFKVLSKRKPGPVVEEPTST
jgi:hypothetical protein